MERTYRRVPGHHVTSRRRRGDADRIRKTLLVSAHDRRWSRMASRVRKRWGVMMLSMVAVPFAFAQAQAPSARAAEARMSKDFMVGHEQVWMSTELDIRPGERVALSARGSARCPGVPGSFGPEGTPREFSDLLRTRPAPEAGRGADAAQTGMSMGQLLQTPRAAEVVRRTSRRLSGGPGEDWRTFHGSDTLISVAASSWSRIA